MSAALTLEGVTKHVRTREGVVRVLDAVDLVVPAGAFYALTGRSGAGKSSLLSIAGGLDVDHTGTASVFGERWQALGERARARLRNARVGFVFQIPRLFANLSVWQNLTAPAWIGSRPLDQTRAVSLLDRVGLADKRLRPVQGLSGGERQRLTVARALVNRPALLLCDEPTGNLDRATGDEVLSLLCELVREEQLTLFIVTHDPAVTERADQVLNIDKGRLPK